MYDLSKRAIYTTLGELRMLLKDMPDDTLIFTCGNSDSWVHFSIDGEFISFDYDSLEDDYRYDLEDICTFSFHDVAVADEIADIMESIERKQIKDHNKRESDLNIKKTK